METKLTLNNRSNFDNPFITKLILLMNFVFYKNKLILNYNSSIIIISLFLTTIAFGQTNHCSAVINVVKNRTVKSVPPQGISYPMNITNNGSESNTFSLTALNVNAGCSNIDGSTTGNNVILVSEFFDSYSNKINSISLNAGESKSFTVRVTIPSGTPQGKWNCTEIMASSQTCSSYKVSTVLHSLVMIPSNDN